MTIVIRSVALRVVAIWFAASFQCRVVDASQPTVEPIRGGRLVVATRAEAKHFNPLIAIDQPTKTVVRLLNADLLAIDRGSLEVAPQLATSWEVSDDGRVYTLELRDGLRFSDGHQVSVDDVVFSFRAYLDERVQSPQRDLLIVGGEPAQIERVDARRVRVTLAEPYAAGERLFDSFAVLPRHLLERAFDTGDIAGAFSLASDPGRIAGLGPFRVKAVVPGERITLERNPFYWKRDDASRQLPYLDEVVFSLVPDEDTQLLQLKAGDVHLIERVNALAFEELSAEPSGVQALDRGPGLEFHFFFFNLSDTDGEHAHRRQWFRDPAFRRALSSAIDKRAVVELVFRGRASVLETHVSPADSFWINAAIPADSYSPEDARRKLEQAGFRWDAESRLIDARGARVEFSLLTNAGNRNRSMIASLIQEDLARIGVGVNIVSQEFRAYVDRIFQSRDFDAALMALASGDADPNPHMSVLLSTGGTHVWRLGQTRATTSWESEIDRLMEQQLVTLDRATRKTLYDRVQQIIHEYRPFIALASPHVLVAARQEVRNFHPGILPPYSLWNADELFLALAERP